MAKRKKSFVCTIQVKFLMKGNILEDILEDTQVNFSDEINLDESMVGEFFSYQDAVWIQYGNDTFKFFNDSEGNLNVSGHMVLKSNFFKTIKKLYQSSPMGDLGSRHDCKLIRYTDSKGLPFEAAKLDAWWYDQ